MNHCQLQLRNTIGSVGMFLNDKNTNYINKSKETREEQREKKVEESRSQLEGGMDGKTKPAKEKFQQGKNYNITIVIEIQENYN